MKHHDRTSLCSIVGLALLASMLFYVSGAAMGLHLQLAHTHAASNDVTQTHVHEDDHAPANDPGTPTRRTCELCRMLIGLNKPVAITSASSPLILETEVGVAPVPVELCVTHFQTPEISRRGPPPVC